MIKKMIHKNPCAICGMLSRVNRGGVTLCLPCHADVGARVEELRAAGEAVNVAHIARALFRERFPGAKSYILRDIPEDLWTAAQHAAVERGASLRELILTALRREVGE